MVRGGPSPPCRGGGVWRTPAPESGTGWINVCFELSGTLKTSPVLVGGAGPPSNLHPTSNQPPSNLHPTSTRLLVDTLLHSILFFWVFGLNWPHPLQPPRPISYSVRLKGPVRPSCSSPLRLVSAQTGFWLLSDGQILLVHPLSLLLTLLLSAGKKAPDKLMSHWASVQRVLTAPPRRAPSPHKSGSTQEVDPQAGVSEDTSTDPPHCSLHPTPSDKWNAA